MPQPAFTTFRIFGLWLVAVILPAFPVRATILWSDLGARVIHATPIGTDILGGKVKRDDKSGDVLYFRFHVDPLSDAANEPYYALFQLCEGETNRLGVGNALEAWGYSAAYTSETGPSNKTEVVDAGEFNLRSAHPSAAGQGAFFPYELVKQNHERTIVFKVQFAPGGDDTITVWLDPDLTHGATADNQPESLTTKFKANASFNQIRLRHDGGFDIGGRKVEGGNGWIFSDMAIADSFSDFVVVRFWQTWWFFTLSAISLLTAVGITVRFVERKKFRFQLQRAEQEHALERERGRIAQDLHDDLGSSLTRISLLSGLLRTDKDNPEQVEAHADPARPIRRPDRPRARGNRLGGAARQRFAAKPGGLHHAFCQRIVRGHTHPLPARPAATNCRRCRCRRISATTFF